MDGKLIEQLESVAHLISLGHKTDLMNYQRQIFYVRLGGFDHHGDQHSEHPSKLRQLSLALGKFQKALEHMGVADKVVSFTTSEFGRTMSNNGDGTDHGWAGANLVISQATGFSGGKIFGTLPDLNMGSSDDSGTKGRFIPKLANEQMLASLCKWFGVDDQNMTSVFPNLANFKSTQEISSAYLENLI